MRKVKKVRIQMKKRKENYYQQKIVMNNEDYIQLLFNLNNLKFKLKLKCTIIQEFRQYFKTSNKIKKIKIIYQSEVNGYYLKVQMKMKNMKMQI